MSRSVDEWVGKTDDTAIPTRVRVRVFERCKGQCHRCTRKIMAGERWSIEHLIALANGGQHRETNMGISCPNCKPIKDAEDAAIKSKGAAIRAKHLGVRQPSRMRSAGFPERPKQHSATRPLERKP